MPFASGLSEHPVTAYAAGEVCGQVLERIGTHPDLALVFTTLAHAGALEDIVAAVREVLHPSVVIGAAAESVVGTGREVETGPGISLWAGRWGPVAPVRVGGGEPAVASQRPDRGGPPDPTRRPDRPGPPDGPRRPDRPSPPGPPGRPDRPGPSDSVSPTDSVGPPDSVGPSDPHDLGASGGRTLPDATVAEGVPFAPRALLLVADPFSFGADDLLGAVARRHPGLPVVGGMASGARGPGGTRLALDGAIHTSGAVGAFVGPGVDVVAVVSHGCRPIGRPFVVTDGAATIVRELAGRPALVRLEEMAGSLTPGEVRSVNSGGLHLGRVLDESKPDFGPGDFRVRPVLGGDRDTGAIAVDDNVEVGTTVQFHLRDATGAHEDLDGMLAREAPEAEAAWLFTCNGRGRRLFGVPDHDADLLSRRVGPVPTAGFSAAGELGPVAGRNELHSSAASLLLLREHR